MLLFNLFRKIVKPLYLRQRNSYNFVIGDLFKKKAEQEKIKHQKQHESSKQRKQHQSQNFQLDEDEYDMIERRREIDTSIDFTKLRKQNPSFIPNDIGKGGFQQVLYWSQNAKTPQQINEIVYAFNKVVVPKHTNEEIHFQHFKNNLIAIIYLAESHTILAQYSYFGFRYQIAQEEYWQKIQYKSLKIIPKSEQEMNSLINTTFFMSQFKYGDSIYNNVEQYLIEKHLTIEQIVKLCLTFFHLRKGKKVWIDKLLQNLDRQIHQANEEQISEVLTAVKETKKHPENLNTNIEKRVLQLINQFNFNQILNVCHFFGFQEGSNQLWKALERRAIEELERKNMSAKLLHSLINKIVLTYKFSLDFIRKFVIEGARYENYRFLDELRPKSLSALSKGLYIYQLEKETEDIETEIEKQLIGKISKNINDISDDELVTVIKDYNLTRHGNRQIYIFFEEVIKVKFIQFYIPELNRNTIESLISIYENSGMCSEKMFTSLKGLIL